MSSPVTLAELISEGTDAFRLVSQIAQATIRIVDRELRPLFECSPGLRGGPGQASVPLRVEAEPVGTLHICGANAPAAADLLRTIVDAIYRRKLTVSLYEETVTDGYERLALRNAQLAELAASLQDQVAARTRELDEAHARIAREEKAAAIGRLAAGLAHELNTPLACIGSNLASLIDPLTEAGEREEIVGECSVLIARAAKVVRDMRGFSHVDDLGMAHVLLRDEVDGVVARLTIPPEVEVVTSHELLLPVPVDGSSFCIALLHLLENALDAVRGGGTIRVTTAQYGDFAAVSIEDDGPRIDDESLRRAFEPFFTTKDVGQGAGLGLTVARDVARAHGGDLTLKRLDGGGTLARLLVPYAAERAKQQ